MKLEEYRRQLARNPAYQTAEAELRPLLDLANDILALRLEHEWSQAELAERVGTAQANISRLESGLANPTVKLLKKLGDALGADLTIHLSPVVPRAHYAAGAYQEQTATQVTHDSYLVKNWPIGAYGVTTSSLDTTDATASASSVNRSVQ
jgi:transcriptional regulator with XRE-family HTH domain